MIDLKKTLSRDFANSLTLVHGDVLSHWEVKHNLAISTWRFGKAISAVHLSELVVLNMAQSIYLLIHGEGLGGRDNVLLAPCGYGVERVIVPMFEAMQDRLNFDCGRLDCGALSRWIETQKNALEAKGFDVRD